MTSKTKSRIDWVNESCRLLAAIRKEFIHSQPFDGMTIGTGIHLEPKTAALLTTLKAGGARVVATGNLSSTQPTTIDYLQTCGIEVHAEATIDASSQNKSLARILAEKPDILLDNGGDLFVRYLSAPYDGLIGGTEETTSGRMRLEPLRDQLAMPILVINDSPIKQFAENKHAVGQSIFESYMRLTNRATNGKRVTVFGYGACGQGVAAAFRNAYSIVSVVDVDPVTTLSAHFDGYATPNRDDAISSADVIVTETGAANVLTAEDTHLFKDGLILMNGGHFPTEIDVAGVRNSALTTSGWSYANEGIESLQLSDGRVIHILCEGHMANLAGPRPLGNSIESMDIGFALQARCLERIARGEADKSDCIVPVPSDIDAQVATDYLAFTR
ncbi:MAG: adenosylhomocysteinase [Paracoccaceae bacterium]